MIRFRASGAPVLVALGVVPSPGKPSKTYKNVEFGHGGKRGGEDGPTPSPPARPSSVVSPVQENHEGSCAGQSLGGTHRVMGAPNWEAS